MIIKMFIYKEKEKGEREITSRRRERTLESGRFQKGM